MKSTYLKNQLRYNFIVQQRIKYVQKLFNPELKERVVKSRLKRVVDAAFQNKFYGKWYSSLGINRQDIAEVSDLKYLPILNKEGYRKLVLEFEKSKKPFHVLSYTGGSTSEPLPLYRTLDSIWWEEAYVWWYRKRCGLDFNTKKISIRGNLKNNKNYYLDRTSNTLHISSHMLFQTKISNLIDRIKAFNPVAILAYPSAVYLLAQYLKENQIKLSIGLCFTSSEMLWKHQKELINETIGSSIFDWFGNSERTIALFEEDGLYYELPAYSIKTYMDNHLISTNLINPRFPLINYQVDDVLEVTGFKKEYTSPIIGRLKGKSDNELKLPNGKTFTRIDQYFAKTNHVLSTQILQLNLEHIVIRLHTSEKFSVKDKQDIYEICCALLPPQMKIEIVQMHQREFYYAANGKFKFIVTPRDLLAC